MINNWSRRKFIIFFAVVEIAELILVLCNYFGARIPFLIEFVSCIYILVLPGVILLRLLKFHDSNITKVILYIVGLSLVFDMLLGFVANELLPWVGIINPFSQLPLLFTWLIVLSILCVLAAIVDRKYRETSHIYSLNRRDLVSPVFLFSVFLPVFTVLGAQLVRLHNENSAYLILLTIISVLPIFALIKNVLSDKYHEIIIYSVALSLVWHLSLSSQYLIQWDSFLEYYYFNQVVETGIWNISLIHTYNAMLSVTVLPAIINKFTGLSGTVIFKLIYSAIYALVPVGLFIIYKKYFNQKLSFLAVFFFMAIYVFALETPSLGRQMIGELFFVLIIISMLDIKSGITQQVLFVLCAAGLIVSHYSLSYIFMFFLVGIVIFEQIIKRKNKTISYTAVLIFVVMGISWFMYSGGGASLQSIAEMGKNISAGFISEFLNMGSRDVSSLFTTASSNLMSTLYRFLWYLILLFLAIGGIRIVIKWFKEKSISDFSVFAIFNYVLLGVCVVIPFFSNQLGVQRIVHITSIILAPFCLIGMGSTWNFFRRLGHRLIRTLQIKQGKPMLFSAIIITVFFIFNLGITFEFAKSDVGRTFPLAISDVYKNDSTLATKELVRFRMSTPTSTEVAGAQWLAANKSSNNNGVYATHWLIGVPVLESYGNVDPEKVHYLIPSLSIDDIGKNYVYLGYVNTVYGLGTTRTMVGEPDPYMGNVWYWDISQVGHLLSGSLKIYATSSSQIYWNP